MLEWMGLNFYYYDGLQPKMRAGIINEHECSGLKWMRKIHLNTQCPPSSVLAQKQCKNAQGRRNPIGPPKFSLIRNQGKTRSDVALL